MNVGRWAGRAMLTRAFLMLEVAKEHRATREMGGFVNVKVKVKESCRLQATGYRVVRVESGRGFGEGNQYRKHLEGLGLE